jgi:flavin-dependent dehydrogenase
VVQPFIRQGHKRAPGIVSVWGGAEPYVNDFFRDIDGSGWQVDRSAFDGMLAKSAEKAGTTVRSGSHLLTSPRRTVEGWAFEFACQDKRSDCRCKFLIDATGRSGTSWLSHLSPRVVLDRLIGVVWTGKQSGEWPYTLVESIDDGWFYSANLPGERMTVVYMTDSDLYRQGLRQFADLWWRQLSKASHVRKRLPGHADISKLRLVSAASMARLNPVGRDWCAVGDAAMSHDPLSGRGVNHALESAFQAAPAVQRYLEQGEPLGTYRHWVAGMLHSHLVARKHYYAAERRWLGSAFWQRRACLPVARPSTSRHCS